eukprot:m.153480 g.153480  ORF g.153480 m.153480 type:complete len:99 (+) comp15068_c0_seq3:131-427(+)
MRAKKFMINLAVLACAAVALFYIHQAIAPQSDCKEIEKINPDVSAEQFAEGVVSCSRLRQDQMYIMVIGVAFIGLLLAILNMDAGIVHRQLPTGHMFV